MWTETQYRYPSMKSTGIPRRSVRLTVQWHTSHFVIIWNTLTLCRYGHVFFVIMPPIVTSVDLYLSSRIKLQTHCRWWQLNASIFVTSSRFRAHIDRYTLKGGAQMFSENGNVPDLSKVCQETRYCYNDNVAYTCGPVCWTSRLRFIKSLSPSPTRQKIKDFKM